MTVRQRLTAAVVVVVTVAAVGWWLLRRNETLQYFGAKIERGTVRDAVDATGTATAVITVLVGSQVSGSISKLFVDFNAVVHRGDTLALIDPSLLRGAVQQATADLANAKASVVAADAGVEKATSAQALTTVLYERTLGLAKQGFETTENVQVARANVDAAVATVHAARAAVAQANAQVQQKAAALAVANTNLGYTVIRSPIAGIVVARNVDVGQTVAASLQAPTIFTIARDLSQMLVYAKIDESEVGRIKRGQAVTFKVDAFPGEQFHGTVKEVRMNATTVQNVVTYDAVIEFANAKLQIFPGMTAFVTIPVATVDNVLKLPNAALRYKPPLSVDEVRELFAKYNVPDEPTEKSKRSGADSAATAARGESAVVWRLRPDRTLEPLRVVLGITDHAFTEIRSVQRVTLNAGDEIVTGSIAGKAGVGVPTIR